MLRGARRPLRLQWRLLRRLGVSGRLLRRSCELRRRRPELLHRRRVPRGIHLQQRELRPMRRRFGSMLRGRCVQRGQRLHGGNLQSTASVRRRWADLLRARVRPRTRVRRCNDALSRASGLWPCERTVLRRRHVYQRARLHERLLSDAAADVRQRRSAMLHRQHMHGRSVVRRRNVFVVPWRRNDVYERRRLLQRMGLPSIAVQQRLLPSTERCVHELEPVLRLHALQQHHAHLHVSYDRAELRRLDRMLYRHDVSLGHLSGTADVPRPRRHRMYHRQRLLFRPSLRTLARDQHLLPRGRRCVHAKHRLLRFDAVLIGLLHVSRTRRELRVDR